MPFPNIKPSGRAFMPGDYPVKTFKAQSGKESRILYGSQRSGGELQLTFENITNADANSFITHYDETQGTYATFTLPANIYVGSSQAYFNAGTGTAWRYAEQPTVTSVYTDRSSVTVRLVAVL